MDLPEIQSIDDLALLVEKLKLGLVSAATSDEYEFSDEEYKRIRKILLSNPMFTELIPSYLKLCRNLSGVWQYIKHEFSTYAERRGFHY
ncbi:MAG: hypothetical protein IPL28_23170 [Chloroflexi bacterium]|nr:hypothetical protein [Chloroflexota bacterium]